MKIMIVDDHAPMRRVLMNIVEASGLGHVDIVECESGEDAVDLYVAQRPDCVLMDVQLGKMSGFQATEKIRSHDAQAKVVIVTSFDSTSVRSKAIAMSVDGFVSKDDLADIQPILQSIHSDTHPL